MQVNNYVVCVNFGDKYGPEYVENLYEMVADNCTIPYGFLTITDDYTKSGRSGTTFVPEEHFDGWWNKMHIYRADLPAHGNILYLDLDVVITGNIDDLFTYGGNNWATLNDFIRLNRMMTPKTLYNSSVVKFKVGQLDHVWRKFLEDPHKNSKTPGGDQAFLHKHTILTKPPAFYPDKWITSYRWDIRQNGLKDTNKIAVFHGLPNPLDKEVLEKEAWVRKALRLSSETAQAD